MTEVEIFKYDNFRHILRDYYQEQKRKYPKRFSYRYFSKQAGFKTSNFFQLVIKGDRNLGYESIKKITKVMKLRGRKYDYFENLVFFNQAKASEEKNKFYEKLVSFKEYQDARLVNDSQKLYFSKWYYPVVREMLNLPFFKPDAEWIAAHIQPRIKQEQAQEALDILLKLNLVEIAKDGRWTQKDSQLKTQDQGVGHEVIAYHRKMIHLGFESINKPPSSRDISGITMSISPAKFKLIQNRIASFRDDIQSLIKQPIDQDSLDEICTESMNHNDKGKMLSMSSVCQLNIQFFHLSRKGKDLE